MVTDEFVQLSENRIVYYDESGCMVYGEKNIYGSCTILTRFMEIWLEV